MFQIYTEIRTERTVGWLIGMAMGIYFLVYVQFDDIKLEGYGCCSTLKSRKKKSEEWERSVLKPLALESKDCLGTPFVY